MKRISVAMAVFNGEDFIRKQIDSILNQLSEEDELVISDDHSTDRTRDIVEEYRKKNSIVRLATNPNKGVFANFENAISECTGEYIFLSDQDDIWIADKIKVIIDDFKRLDVDMIIHNGYHINEDDQRISDNFFSEYHIKRGVLKNYLKPRYSGCCIAFTNELRNRIIPIPKNVGAYDHWVGMVGEIYGKVYFESKPLIMHRIHNNNVTVKTRSIDIVLKARINILVELIKLKRKQNAFK